MRQLHDFYVDLECYRQFVMEWYSAVDPFHLSHQRHQFGLTTDDHLPRNLTQRLRKPDKLDGIAKPVIAADKHQLVCEILAPPDPLLVPGSRILRRAGQAIFAQTSVA